MRNITPETFTDEFFGSLTPMQRLLWLGLLLCMADDQGRMSDNPALFRSTIFPYDEDVSIKDVQKAIDLFVKQHKLHRYAAGSNGSGKGLLQVVNWWRYQRSAQWAGRSQYPAPDNWVDRIRTHEAGHGSKPVTLNWDKLGGFIEPTKPATKRLRRARKKADKVEPTKPQGKRKVIQEDEDEVKDKDNEEGQIKESYVNEGAQTKSSEKPPFSSRKPKGLKGIKQAAQERTGA